MAVSDRPRNSRPDWDDSLRGQGSVGSGSALSKGQSSQLHGQGASSVALLSKEGITRHGEVLRGGGQEREEGAGGVGSLRLVLAAAEGEGESPQGDRASGGSKPERRQVEGRPNHPSERKETADEGLRAALVAIWAGATPGSVQRRPQGSVPTPLSLHPAGPKRFSSALP